MVGTTARRFCQGILLLAGMMLIAACSETPAATTTSTTPPTTTTTAAPPPTTTTTTTTVAPTTTTVDPLARPDVLVSNVNRDSIDDFDTSKDNVYEAAMELQDLFVFLEGNPTEDADAMVSLLYERGYPYWNPILIGFLELTDHPGWHYVDPGVRTLGINVTRLEDNTAVVRIADEREKQIVANSAGTVVKEYSGWERRSLEFTLLRGADGLWRYADAQPPVPLTEEELSGMVPVQWSGRS